MIASFLKTFLLANFLLLFSYFIFTLAQNFFRVTKVFVSHQQLVRWGQVFVLTSALAPFLLTSIPGKSLPEMKMPSFRSASEGSAKNNRPTYPAAQTKRESLTPSINPTQYANIFYQIRNAASTDPLTLTFFLWLMGLFFFATRLFLNFLKLNQLITKSIGVRALGKIRVAVSNSLAVPISALHWGKYWVILPEQMVSARSDWKLALKHELQHHRQGDTLWAFLVEWVVCFFYFNPAVYLWKRRITELQEFSCDEALVGQQRISSREYGSCLVRVAETALGCREVYVGTTYMAAAAKNPMYFKSFLQRRIEMLLRKKSRPRKWMGLCIGTLGLMATVSLAYGIEQSARKVANELPNPGKVVVDEKIQKITLKILSDSIVSENAGEGFAIVADPQTGKILAVANVDTKQKKKGFWSLSQQMEPASIAKTLLIAEAIEQGKTTPTEKHFCENGKYKFEGRVFYDWKTIGFDQLTTSQAVAQSSDICTVKIAEKIGVKGIFGLLEKYGFGSEGSAKEFPGSRVGQIPPKDGKLGRFFIPFVAYGQGFRSTPLELVQAYGAIANGGNLLMPISADAPDSAKKVVRRVLSAENAEKVKGILRDVVLTGTGKKNAGSYLYTTAGKTASSFSPDDEWLEGSRGTRKANVAGFIGFAPLDNPRVLVYVSIHDPKVSIEPNSGAHGSEHAAPVFKQITEAVLQQMKVEPDNLQRL